MTAKPTFKPAEVPGPKVEYTDARIQRLTDPSGAKILLELLQRANWYEMTQTQANALMVATQWLKEVSQRGD